MLQRSQDYESKKIINNPYIGRFKKGKIMKQMTYKNKLEGKK